MNRMRRAGIIIGLIVIVLLVSVLFLMSKHPAFDKRTLPHLAQSYLPFKGKRVLDRINANRSLKHIMDSLQINSGELKVLVVKSKFELSVWHNGKELKNYPVALGINPVDDKLQQGDRCTPEGFFHIQAKYPSDKWEKFIWLDYPNTESWRKYKLAVKAGKIKAGTDIGGEVGIHGVPKGHDDAIGPGHHWTWGCVCLTHDDINELYGCVNSKTLVEIRRN